MSQKTCVLDFQIFFFGFFADHVVVNIWMTPNYSDPKFYQIQFGMDFIIEIVNLKFLENLETLIILKIIPFNFQEKIGTGMA